MIQRTLILSSVTLLAASSMLADFSYQETTTITGGALAGMMKVVGIFSKTLREPIRSSVYIKGDRMVHRGNNNMQIIDLSAETITNVDTQKKTYAVMTFEQMRQMLEQASQEMKKKDKGQGEIKWKVSANATGNSRQIAGYDAKEMVLKMEMEATDKEKGEKGSMDMTSHIWLAPNVAGYQEMRDFQKRMAEKLNWTPGGNPFMSQPEVTKGLAEASKEMSKLDGAPVFQTMVMGGSGAAAEGQQAPPQQQKQAERPSLGGALGGALGGRLGLGRKKTQEPPAPAADAPPAAASSPDSLLEMTTEYSNFSNGPVDESQISIPAGFKKVEPDLKRAK
jgi:hypothetical protein